MLAPMLVMSQTSKKGEGLKRKAAQVKVKVMVEEDGKTTLIDTSFDNITDAKAAMKNLKNKKRNTESTDDEQVIELFLDGENEDGYAKTGKNKTKIMIYGDLNQREETAKALKKLKDLKIELPDLPSFPEMPEMPDLSEMPEIRMFHHDWAMNDGKSFSLGVTDAGKEELNKLGIKTGNTDDLIEDVTISGLSSKNKLKVTFEVIEPINLSIKVLNSDGKEVYSQSHSRYSGSFNNSIDFGRRIKGVYYLIIAANGKNLVKKISRELS